MARRRPYDEALSRQRERSKQDSATTREATRVPAAADRSHELYMEVWLWLSKHGLSADYLKEKFRAAESAAREQRDREWLEPIVLAFAKDGAEPSLPVDPSSVIHNFKVVAREQEREACRDAMCVHCADGEPVVERDGRLVHPWEPEPGTSSYSGCTAAAIRARDASLPSGPAPAVGRGERSQEDSNPS